MAICIQERGGLIHIIGWTTGKGNHYTLCDRFFRKDRTMQTFALDNTFNGICKTCKVSYDTMYKDDLEWFLQWAHGQLLEDLHDNFTDIERGRVKIQHIYDYLTTKFNKYQAKAKK